MFWSYCQHNHNVMGISRYRNCTKIRCIVTGTFKIFRLYNMIPRQNHAISKKNKTRQGIIPFNPSEFYFNY